MKKLIIISLILLPLPLYLFGTVVLDIPGPVDLIATGDCNIIDMGEICRDSFRREINILGAIFLGAMLMSFLVGVGLLLHEAVKRIIRAVRLSKN